MATTPKPFSARQERFGTALTRVMSVANTWLYRRTKGKFGGRIGKAPVCILTTTGRVSGLARSVALFYLRDGDDVVVVASKGGMSEHPEWYRNLSAEPKVSIEISGQTRVFLARTARAPEKADMWPKLVAMYKSYDTYRARTSRDIPVVICTPVGL